jgi:dolichol-phosphate mannosyltransferase
MDVLVVLPTYNEAKTLERIVSSVVAGGSSVLIVDDNSPDGTGRLADDLARTSAAVSVLHRQRKEGLGRAYAAGFEVALDSGFAIICEMDADGSHDPAAIADLRGAVVGGADLAIGSRFVPGGGFEGIPMARRLLSRLGNLYANLALGLGVRDATSGFRATGPISSAISTRRQR